MLEGEWDDLYDDVARFVAERQDASVSSLQRQFRIGFSRAMRLLGMMQEDELVSAPSAVGKRDVLVPADYFVKVDEQVRASEPQR